MRAAAFGVLLSCVVLGIALGANSTWLLFVYLGTLPCSLLLIWAASFAKRISISGERREVPGVKPSANRRWFALAVLGLALGVMDVRSELTVEMPKYSFIAANPDGRLNSLPDKDVLTFTRSGFPEKIEIYFLSHARFKVVRDFVSTASYSDLVLNLAAYLFWPVVGLSIGVFHKGLSDRIVETAKGLLHHKDKRHIGFAP